MLAEARISRRENGALDRVCVKLRLATKPQKRGDVDVEEPKTCPKRRGKCHRRASGKSTHFLVPPFGQAGQLLYSGYRGVRGPANAHKAEAFAQHGAKLREREGEVTRSTTRLNTTVLERVRGG